VPSILSRAYRGKGGNLELHRTLEVPRPFPFQQFPGGLNTNRRSQRDNHHIALRRRSGIQRA
jgi:hypothetical protein